VSAATSSPAGATGESTVPPPPASNPGGEACPLCGSPLHPEQEWCLSCGAAARTRLAASPNWKAPLVAAVVVVVLSLGVLAAALVKLAGDTGPAPPVSTKTITTAAATVAPAATSTTPTLPTQSTPGAATTPGTSTGTGAAGVVGAPGASTTTTPATAGTGSKRANAKALELLRKAGLLPKK